MPVVSRDPILQKDRKMGTRKETAVITLPRIEYNGKEAAYRASRSVVICYPGIADR